jgi:glutamate-5-semialdehyde dehydrogenase
MNLKYKVLEQCENAKEAALKLAVTRSDVKNIILYEIAQSILANKKKIILANNVDVKNKKGKISGVLLKRLMVDDKKIREMAEMIKSVAKLANPTGKILARTELDKGFVLEKISVPIGVIACIFESRPEVIIQISALAIKSGNAVLLKGGSEAINTNRFLAEVIRATIRKNRGISEDSVQLLENREAVREILKMDEFIDLIIPRGSNKFVKYIQDNTKIAVLGHSGGICHVYVDKDANFNKAMRIAIDAKCQYPAVCNAMETLLVHRDIAKRFLPAVVKKYLENKVEVRLDNEGLKIVNMGDKLIRKASGRDWGTEYNDLIISIKIVGSVNEAVEHINKYGSRHTDGIVTENKKTAFYFMEIVDSGSVMWNASTRFSDGYRYGLGAEVGISTGKIHARGPVGLEGLTTYKYRLMGDGQIVADYSGKNAKRFTHKKLK